MFVRDVFIHSSGVKAPQEWESFFAAPLRHSCDDSRCFTLPCVYFFLSRIFIIGCKQEIKRVNDVPSNTLHFYIFHIYIIVGTKDFLSKTLVNYLCALSTYVCRTLLIRLDANPNAIILIRLLQQFSSPRIYLFLQKCM